MRKDTQRKFCWHSPYDLRATERWLEAQAQKGLLLRRWDTPVVFDRVGEPRQVHYRLEPICPALPRTQEQEGLYRQSGWQEVCPIGREFRVWSSTLPHPPELHTDPVALGWAFRSQEKHTRRWLAFFLAATVLLWVWFLWPVLTVPYGLAVFLERGESTWLYLNCYSLLQDVGLALRLRQLRRTRRSLEAGVLPAGRKRPILNLAAFTACTLLALGLLFTASSLSWFLRRPELEWGQVPFLSLEKLETSQSLSAQVLPHSDLPTWVSPTYLVTSSSYECTESSSLYRFYAKTRWAFLAEPYVRAWLQREQAEEAQPQIVAGFDHAWACRLPGGGQLFVALRDDEVVILQYAGQADLLEAVEDYGWTFPLAPT